MLDGVDKDKWKINSNDTDNDDRLRIFFLSEDGPLNYFY